MLQSRLARPGWVIGQARQPGGLEDLAVGVEMQVPGAGEAVLQHDAGGLRAYWLEPAPQPRTAARDEFDIFSYGQAGPPGST